MHREGGIAWSLCNEILYVFLLQGKLAAAAQLERPAEICNAFFEFRLDTVWS